MKLAIDAMGGDHAPKEVVLGAIEAVREIQDLEIILFGNEKSIKEYLVDDERIKVIHTEEVITSDDEPVRAVRRKKDASMVVMAQYVKDKKADACISAGNTGALMSAGLFILGRIKGIERPALAPTLPTKDGKGFLLLDVGANVDAKAQHLLQYGIMGSIYAKEVRKVENPRIGLLNIGTEQGKGNELTKRAYDLLTEAPVNFIGNIEARDLLEGQADVIVTDGFSGNVALKTIEGTASMMFSLLKDTFTQNMKTKLAAGMIKSDLRNLRDQLDYSEYGGAGLFGLSAPVIKAHGSSNARAIYNAIRQASDMVENQVANTIEKTILSMDRESSGE